MHEIRLVADTMLDSFRPAGAEKPQIAGEGWKGQSLYAAAGSISLSGPVEVPLGLIWVQQPDSKMLRERTLLLGQQRKE